MNIRYPSLYVAADDFSSRNQVLYLRLIKTEYFLLITAATLSMNLSEKSFYHISHATVFSLALAAFLFRSLRKPEQDWYKGRALAESIKTSTWRYCMKAPPFEDDEARSDFRKYLIDIFEANKVIGRKLPANAILKDLITKEMEGIRNSPLNSRKEVYLKNRIIEQGNWYETKAVSNASSSARWTFVSCATYGLAILFILLQIWQPAGSFPISALIAIAASIVGWTQIKKFNELASAYTLTAFEIRVIKDMFRDVVNEGQFANFVADSEQAFSREHTQWLARRNAA